MTGTGSRRGSAAVLVVTAVLAGVLAGCSGTGDSVQVRATAAPSSGAATSPSAPSPSATAPATSLGDAATGSPAPSSTAPAASSTASAAGTPSSASTGSSSSSGAARWPEAIGEPQQGQPAWGVYLAVGHSTTDAVVERAVRQAARVGYSAVVGDIACDGGAMEALKLDQFDYWTGATLYFATQADARTFAASYAAEVAKPRGIVKVKVGCLD